MLLQNDKIEAAEDPTGQEILYTHVSQANARMFGQMDHLEKAVFKII